MGDYWISLEHSQEFFAVYIIIYSSWTIKAIVRMMHLPPVYENALTRLDVRWTLNVCRRTRHLWPLFGYFRHNQWYGTNSDGTLYILSAHFLVFRLSIFNSFSIIALPKKNSLSIPSFIAHKILEDGPVDLGRFYSVEPWQCKLPAYVVIKGISWSYADGLSLK